MVYRKFQQDCKLIPEYLTLVSDPRQTLPIPRRECQSAVQTLCGICVTEPGTLLQQDVLLVTPSLGTRSQRFEQPKKGYTASTVQAARSLPPGRGHTTGDFVGAKPCNRTSLPPALLSCAQTTKKATGLTPMDDDHHDDSHATDDHRRWLGGTAVDGNTGSDGELAFMLSGWVLLSVAVGNYFLSRWSEIRLLRKAGCTSTQEYHTRLCVIEKTMIETKVGETSGGEGGGGLSQHR